jgi:uncharacterized membrane protein YdjX (TVP38/TMEM64 family)
MEKSGFTKTTLQFIGRYQRLLYVVAFLAILFAVFHFSGLRGQISLANVREQLQAHPRMGLLIYVLLFSLGNMVQIPGTVFISAAILALGPLWGGLYTYVASNVSAVVTFLSIRFIGGNALQSIERPFMKRILARLATHPVQTVIVARLCFQSLPALNYALAMSGVKLRHLVAGTLLGMPLFIVLYCVFFDQIAKWLGIV